MRNLIAIIEDEEQQIYSELHAEIQDNKVEYCGFSIENNKLTPFNYSSLEKIFQQLKLSEHHTYLGKKEEYDIYFDQETQLYHFFRNGIEDIKKLFEYNSEDATLYKMDENKSNGKMNPKLRKFISGALCTGFAFSMTFISIMVNAQIFHPSEIKNFSDVYYDEKYPQRHYLSGDDGYHAFGGAVCAVHQGNACV